MITRGIARIRPGALGIAALARGNRAIAHIGERCDLLVRIPMSGEVESLNVSVSAGVCLFESVRRRKGTQVA